MPKRLKPLTDVQVRALRKTMLVGGAPGLELRVTGQSRSWRLYYRLPGIEARRTLHLGAYPDVSLSAARAAALDKLRMAKEGIDPKRVREQRALETQLTLKVVVDRYLAYCVGVNKPATVQDKISTFRNQVLPKHGGIPIRTFTRADALEILDALGDRPALRRNVFTYLKTFLGWCADRDLIPTNPIASLKPPKAPPSRERVLSDKEICEVWAATGVAAVLARLGLLTAQRPGSIRSMRWEDLNFRTAIWTIPPESMKMKRVHEVPLAPAAIEILQALPRMTGPYVFGVRSDGMKPYQGASNGIEILREQIYGPKWRDLPIQHWHFHDLRRTSVTLAQRGGALIEEMRALTDHKTPGVIGIYARYRYSSEKVRVVRIIAEQLDQITGRGAAAQSLLSPHAARSSPAWSLDSLQGDLMGAPRQVH